MTSTNPLVIPRDANGLVFRQAAVEVPTATNRGDQPGISPGCSNLYGIHIPFSDQMIQQLYPTHADYVAKVKEAVRRNNVDGFVLIDDAKES